MFLCGTNLNPSLFMAPVFLAAIMAMLGFGAANARASDSELKVVDHVDVNRYVGTWYEIAKMPVFFQRDCAGGTTATYKLLKEGTISVVNRCCEADKELKEAKGRAWVVDKKTNAKLKVSFFSILGFYPFKGDYWIIDLGPQYEYAVVGNPGRTMGWILSRTPTLSDDLLKGIAERLEANGYDFSKFEMTNQVDYTCGPE